MRTNIAQIQAFKTETIERYIAEQVPVVDNDEPLLNIATYKEEVEDEKGWSFIVLSVFTHITNKTFRSFIVTDEVYLDENEEEIEEEIIQPIQSRFHDFKPPVAKSVPTIIETSNVPVEVPPEKVPVPSSTISDETPESPEVKPSLDLLDPMDRDPAILSDSSDIAYETLEVEFIDDDADWEDEEFDDEPEEIYSGDESPDPDDIESPVSHDEEEEEVVSDVDDTELMARLEAKYGKLNN